MYIHTNTSTVVVILIGVVYFDVKDRQFLIDMSGFASSVKLLYNNTKVQFRHDILYGKLETAFLESDVPVEEFEQKGDNCTKVCKSMLL